MSKRTATMKAVDRIKANIKSVAKTFGIDSPQYQQVTQDIFRYQVRTPKRVQGHSRRACNVLCVLWYDHRLHDRRQEQLVQPHFRGRPTRRAIPCPRRPRVRQAALTRGNADFMIYYSRLPMGWQ